MHIKRSAIFCMSAIAMMAVSVFYATAQTAPQREKRYRVENGVLVEIKQSAPDSLKLNPEEAALRKDSLAREAEQIRRSAAELMTVPEIVTDTVFRQGAQIPSVTDSLRSQAEVLYNRADSLTRVIDEISLTEHYAADTMRRDSVPTADMSRRERRRMERLEQESDPDYKRYSPIFRDTMGLSKMTAISLAVPGFSQLHNKQYWKIPVLYGTVGTTAYFGIREHKKYRNANNYHKWLQQLYYEHDWSATPTFGAYDKEGYFQMMDGVYEDVVKYNTTRQIFFGTMLAAYIYFIADGVVNYPGETSRIKKATTLSTVFPGAGQIYNGSYWKAPIVMGGFATMIYMIDWNNRGYQRYKRAVELYPNNEFKDRQNPPDVSSLVTYRSSFRRNRDLCIILLGAVYLINIVDAHVDAHMQDYDISSNLNITVEPSMTDLIAPPGANSSMVGMSLKLRF